MFDFSSSLLLLLVFLLLSIVCVPRFDAVLDKNVDAIPGKPVARAKTRVRDADGGLTGEAYPQCPADLGLSRKAVEAGSSTTTGRIGGCDAKKMAATSR